MVLTGEISSSSGNLKIARTMPLHSDLREVSGIAYAEGRLFAHNDERGTIFQIDTATGEIVKQFAVGERRLRDDFEDMAVAEGTFYLIASDGKLYSFSEGDDRTNVPETLHETGLERKNDVEGLCYDPPTNSLLIACKGDPGKGLGKVKAVWSWSLKTGAVDSTPRFTIDLKELKDRFKIKDFQPSGIARNPLTGNFFLISAAAHSIIEIEPGGKVVSSSHLDKKQHTQPEGITFDEAGALWIANEGLRKGSITIYEPPTQPGGRR